MLIVCPSCVSAYRMPPEATEIGAKAARCAQCGAVFTPAAVSLAEPALPAQAGPLMLSLPAAPPGHLPAMRPIRSLPVPDEAPRQRRTDMLAAMGFAACLLFGMGILGARTHVAAAVPASAPLFAAIGLPVAASDLVLGNVESTLGAEGPAKVLTLAGKITNARPDAADIPNLRIVVRDAAEQTVYSWVAPAPRPRLGPGETVDFSSRLVSPPANGHDLVVSFADRTDGAVPARVKSGQ